MVFAEAPEVPVDEKNPSAILRQLPVPALDSSKALLVAGPFPVVAGPESATFVGL